MLFIILGVLGIALKLGGITPVADWSWLWVLSPFGLAVLWWAWSDKTGRTQRLAMDKMDERKEARRQKAMEALGMSGKKKR
ncbi:MAG TPA: TIGR04438 family Trp-rich protein [Burkholderiaceae bacterium]